MKFQTFIIFIILLILTKPIVSEKYELSESQKKDLENRLTNVINDNELIGLASAFYKDGQLLYENFQGLADQEMDYKIQKETFYRIASISKSFTSATFYTLVDQGKADIDADISEYLGFQVRNPNFPNDIITPRQILSHTSSLNDGQLYDSFLTDTKNASYDPIKYTMPKLQEILQQNGKYYTNDIYLDKQPGTYYIYCNLNFVVIATIIEKISNIRFDKYSSQNLLYPMEYDTTFSTDSLKKDQFPYFAGIYRGETDSGQFKESAFNYHGQKPDPMILDNYQVGTNGAIFSPQGGMKVGVDGMHKFITMLMDNGKYVNSNNEKKQILSKNSVEEMLKYQYKHQNGEDDGFFEGPIRAYGQGIMISQGINGVDAIFPGKVLKGHSGDAYGLLSNMFFQINEKTGYIFVTNGSKITPHQQSKTSDWYKIEQDVIDIANSLLNTDKYIDYNKQDYTFLYVVFGSIIGGGILLFIGIKLVQIKLKKDKEKQKSQSQSDKDDMQISLVQHTTNNNNNDKIQIQNQ